MMSDDMELVRKLAADGSEPAFATLVQRHIGLVHSAASHSQAQQIMEQAHLTCPYSKALRGDTSVKLIVD